MSRAKARSVAKVASVLIFTFTVPHLLAWDVVYLQKSTAAPVIQSAAPSQSIGVVGGSTLTFSIQAQDPDGNPLTYTWAVNGQIIAGVFGPQFSLPLQTCLAIRDA